MVGAWEEDSWELGAGSYVCAFPEIHSDLSLNNTKTRKHENDFASISLVTIVRSDG
jgi:hypothetical protein